MKKEVIAHKDPKSPISEIFRTLRTNIQFMDTNKKMKTLLVTSTFPGEGKSWVTSNLAVTFAQAGKKVILVDADMRKGRQYAIFEVSPKPGLSNYLSQVEFDENGNSSEDLNNYIQETDVRNLYVISAGNIPPNPSELLVSTQMINLINQLKQICDIVIIDGTPCELVTDSVILSRIVDSTIIVTAHKMTKKDALERVIRNIQNVGGTIAGVVLNRVPITGKKYEEKYYYYGNTEMKSKKHPTTVHHNTTTKTSSNIREQKPKSNNIINKSTESLAKKDFKENINNLKNSSNTEFLDKTNEILKQINDYLDNEKKKMN